LDETAPTFEGIWFGETLDEVFKTMSKEHNLGYRFRFEPLTKRVWFETFYGTDRTTEQTAVEPIRWSANWGDTRDEVLISSNKDYRNVCYLQSGDETNPIAERVGAEVGWERFEMFSDANDIKKDMSEDETAPL